MSETAMLPVTDAALEVRGVTVNYGAVNAVDSVDLVVPRGTIVGLIGPNGAGKTTFFDAICGYAPISQGRVVLGGRDITGLAPSERSRAGLGRSFQDARLFPSLTVTEALACAYERHLRGQDPVSIALGLPWVRRTERRIASRVDEIVDLMGLGRFRDKFIAELSTGSRRIVDLAAVLLHDPTVLLLDEPSSGIAQKETEALGPLLLQVKEQTGATMLVIEHDMPLITSVSDELVALEVGRVIAQGTPREVTNNPHVVEAYLGTDERIVARSGEVSIVHEPAVPKRRAPKKKAAAQKRAAPAKKQPAKKAVAKKQPAKKAVAEKQPAKKKAAPAKKKAPRRSA